LFPCDCEEAFTSEPRADDIAGDGTDLEFGE
jgi:hypothetical protein